MGRQCHDGVMVTNVQPWRYRCFGQARGRTRAPAAASCSFSFSLRPHPGKAAFLPEGC